MKSCLAVPLLIAMSAMAAAPASAGKLPPIKASSKNAVPECVTPGRLWAFLKERNPSIDARYEAVAAHYMKHGEELGLRWDFAFYQMIVETGALSYRNGSKPGDVKPSQNNFAGLGATGRGERGESFKDISSGVRAHLQHLQMYAGEQVADPVAERTRKVQEWGVLNAWHAKLKGQGPITFTDLAAQWAPGSRSYASMLEDISEQFDEDFCRKPDPRPELMQEARGNAATGTAAVAESRTTATKQKTAKAEPPVAEESSEKVSGAEIYRRNVEEERRSGTTRAALGAGAVAGKDSFAQPTTILNAPKPEPSEQPSVQAASAPAAAAASAIAKALPTPPPTAAPAKCQVFTASYGGQKAVIIKAAATDSVSYTVLDVNEGSEKRETDAFIQAYAKGGQMVGEFASSNQALDKAFELCPEN